MQILLFDGVGVLEELGINLVFDRLVAFYIEFWVGFEGYIVCCVGGGGCLKVRWFEVF